MSREEKEALLNIRMEQIRKKNAELQKRYEVKKENLHLGQPFIIIGPVYYSLMQYITLISYRK